MKNSTTLFCSIFLTLLMSFNAPESFSQKKKEGRRYQQGPDSQRQAGVPVGQVTHHQLLNCKTFPGTIRRYYVYVPKQYDATQPASLMVFQDGHAYINETGEYRAPIVFDNLIHRNEMPVTIGVFVDPGHKKDQLPDKPGWRPQPENRSFEYDTLSDDYSKLLLDEILPLVKKDYNISDDASQRAICGASSGGICAFTAAWERPDQFSKVLSHIGSFTNIRHGDTYPGIIRKSDKKDIRVYLQDGSNDLDNSHGNWPLGNQQMVKALRFKNYDVKFDYGEGAHNGNHGGAILPDALRWLWRDADGVVEKFAIMPESREDDWWVTRHEAKLAERKAMPRVDLLMVGDSITHSWESTGKPVWDEFYAHRNAFNIGFSGDRTEHVIWRLQNGAIDDINPKLAVVMIGTNNTGHRQETAEHTALGIKRIISELKTRLPETKILLLNVFPRDEKPTGKLRQINDGINKIIADFADDKRVWHLDISSAFLDDDGALPKATMPDFLHPQQAGYEMWAKAMEPKIKKLMEE